MVNKKKIIMTPYEFYHLVNNRITYKNWKPIIDYKNEDENGRLICYEFYPYNNTSPVLTKWEYINLKWDEDKITKRIFNLIQDAEEYELHHNFKFDGAIIMAHNISFDQLKKLAPKSRNDVEMNF